MNTEHIEKFVNAIACDLEEGGFRQVSGTTLRRSLTEAVSAALPLLEAGNPVSELVEQQGVGAPDCCEECGRRTFHNHPDGYICLHCKLIVGSRPQDAHFALDALVAVGHVEQGKVDQALAIGAAIAATGKQQVGEVQGDALVTDEMVEAAKRAMYFHCQPDATEGEYLDDKEEGDELAPAFRAALEAALSARQPVGAAEQLDRALGETIDQRDRYHEVADYFAGHIERITGVEIGEHSSDNCPWQNAIEAAESYTPAQGIDLGTGIKAIAAERERQLQVEGFSRDGDQQYQLGELAKAATAYVQLAAQDLAAGTRDHIAWHGPHPVWPWAPEWWKPVDARRDLVRAGALIAAQIDLIDSQRVAAPGVSNG